MGILDGIVEWIAEQVMAGLDVYKRQDSDRPVTKLQHLLGKALSLAADGQSTQAVILSLIPIYQPAAGPAPAARSCNPGGALQPPLPSPHPAGTDESGQKPL